MVSNFLGSQWSKLALCGGLVAAASGLFGSALFAQSPNALVTGKKITLPPLGAQTNVGSLPMNMILTHDGKYAITTDMGFRESLHSISTTTGKDVSAPLVFGKDNGDGSYGPPGLYYGLAIKGLSGGGSVLFAAEGASNAIAVVDVSVDGALSLERTITLKPGDFAAGLAVDKRGYLYVAVNETYPASAVANITTPASLVVIDSFTGTEVGRFSFVLPVGTLNAPGNPPFSPTNFPLAVAALSDGSKVYVSSQRDGKVYALNCSNPAAPSALTAITTGQHPISLLLDRNQSRLFVANAHSETVSVINTVTDTVAHTILLLPTGAEGLPGVTPTGLGLTPDESRLYVSLGDFNAVGVVDLGRYSLTGYIPAGWYPTAVVASPFKNQILVTNAKGTKTRYPNPGYKQYSFAGQYDLNLIEGNVQTIAVPDSAQQPAETQMVLDNNKITASTGHPANPLAGIDLQAGKIKHVIYIIKENRTYDQVLGDEPFGNGDPSLALFGKEITPNLHALAERFVLLDNFYDCGEASGDGWPWSTQGQASEYVIKNLPYNYSGRGRNYDFEGANNNYPVGGFPDEDPYGAPLVPNSPFIDPHTDRAPAIPDVSKAPGGHIWNDVLDHLDLTGTGLTTKYRNYGFFALFGDNVNTPDNYPADPGLQPAGHDLGGITDIDFRRFDTSYADSEGPLESELLTGDADCQYPLGSYGHYDAFSRFTEWNREFKEMLAKDENGSAVPAFQTIRLMHDHTQGLSAGKHTPRSEVADNDYGVGQLVEAVSKSKIWDSTAIFVIEDDAQDGPDHVDAHRSTCYVISPYIKRASVDHTFYNTDSVLKTMELLLGIPPMNQYDAIAAPIMDFAASPAGNNSAYAATLPDPAILCELAPTSPTSALVPLEKLSAKMDFVHPDSAPAALLNEIIWKSVKGVNSPMPAPRHVGLVLPRKAVAQTAAKDSDPD